MAEEIALPYARQDAFSSGSLLNLGGADPRQKYLARLIIPYLTSTTNTLPKLVAGHLLLWDPTQNDWLVILYSDITKYEPRSASAGSKRKVQIPIANGFTGGEFGLTVRRAFYQGRAPIEAPIIHRTATGLDAAGKTAALAAIAEKINAEVIAGVTATSDANYLYIEEKNIGDNLTVHVGAAFGQPEEIAPAAKRALYSDDMRSGDIIPGVLPVGNVPLSAIEIYFRMPVDASNALAGGSSQTDNQNAKIMIPTVALVLFDPAVTASTDAFTELKAILDGSKSAALYLAKGYDGTTATNANLEFKYTINRTDAGNDAALAAMRTAYAGAAFVRSRRSGWNAGAGKSWYDVETNSGTQFAAQGTDTVKRGFFSKDDDDPAAVVVP